MSEGDADLADPAVAADYDLMNAAWEEQVSLLHRLMAGHLPVVTGGLLLDAACGTGASAEAAATMGWHVTAVDASPAMVELARRRVPGVDVRTGDLWSLEDATTNRFHAVTCIGNALIRRERSQLPAALGQLRRRLRDAGTLMIVIRDLTERPRSNVWRDDDVARVQARFAPGPNRTVLYVLEVQDANGFRSHQLTLHAVSPLELMSAVEAAGVSVLRSERTRGWFALSGVARAAARS